MRTEKKQFRRFIGLFLLVAFLFNAAIPAYSEFSVSKNSEQLKSVLGNDLKICTSNGGQTVSYKDYYKLLHGIDDVEKRISDTSKHNFGAASLFSENFSYNSNSSKVFHSLNNSSIRSQANISTQTTRAPPHRII